MSLWEFGAAVGGWNKANGEHKPEPLSEERHDELMAKYA